MQNVLFMAIGWMSAAVSLIRLPFIFGVVGVVMGILGSKNGSKAALALVVASIVFMSLGIFFNDVLYESFKQIMGA